MTPRFSWHQYRTEQDRRLRRPSATLTGRIWSPGPLPGSRWVLPDGLPQGTGSLMIVKPGPGGSWYAVGPVPEGANRA